MIADAKAPLFETTWWVLVSLFVHLTVSPVAIVTEAGEKPVERILTPLVTVAVDWDAPGTTSAATAAREITKLRITEPPVFDGEASLPAETPSAQESSARLQLFYTGVRCSWRTNVATPGGTRLSQSPSSRRAARTSAPEISFAEPSSRTTTS